jgi:transcriptional regulator with XRE-family HTH domain
MARKFKELRARMSAAAQARSHEKAEQYKADMALDELREARRMTQETLAQALNVKQSSISKIERRTDMYVSTLRGIVRGMGGELDIVAVFPDGRVRINQFAGLTDDDLGKPRRRGTR